MLLLVAQAKSACTTAVLWRGARAPLPCRPRRRGGQRRDAHDELLLCDFGYIDGDGGVAARSAATPAKVERWLWPRPCTPIHPFSLPPFAPVLHTNHHRSLVSGSHHAGDPPLVMHSHRHQRRSVPCTTRARPTLNTAPFLSSLTSLQSPPVLQYTQFGTVRFFFWHTERGPIDITTRRGNIQKIPLK
jgi:hypothetical protein